MTQVALDTSTLFTVGRRICTSYAYSYWSCKSQNRFKAVTPMRATNHGCRRIRKSCCKPFFVFPTWQQRSWRKL